MAKKDLVESMFDSIAEIDKNGDEYFRLDYLQRDELVETFIEVESLGTEEFLKVKETLQRIGIANKATKTLSQSCVLLHKKGRFYICHFKELFAMDAKHTEVFEDDYLRRNHVAKLLESWGLIKIINQDIMTIPCEEKPINVYVLPYKDKKDWTLKQKYTIGTVPTKRGNYNE